MYGASKESGSIVGRVGGGVDSVGLDEISERTGCEESLGGEVCGEDGSVQEVTLTARLCPESGDVIWIPDDDDAVMARTRQMSQMTSMLVDGDRNAVYASAISTMIEHFKAQNNGRPPVILDIGAGTGLLSMLSARSGASAVVGCEMFDAWAAVAEQVVADNNFSDVIQIVAAKSTDIDELGADVIVSELLDSALLGESVVFSHADAISRLLVASEGSDTEPSTHLQQIENRVLPHSAQVFAVLVECSELSDLHSVRNLRFGGGARGTPWRDSSAQYCRSGGDLALPVHWTQLKARTGGRELSNPEGVQVLSIPFTKGIPEIEAMPPATEVFETDIFAAYDGTVHGILVFWDLRLLSTDIDPEGKFRYSTKPNAQNWQNHWLQVVYTLTEPMAIAAGERLRVAASHDNLKMRISAGKIDSPPTSSIPKRSKHESISDPVALRRREVTEGDEPQQCTCGWHLLYTSDRILSLNDDRRVAVFEKAMEYVLSRISDDVSPPSSALQVVLDISDGNVLSLTLGHFLRLRQERGESKLTNVRVVSKEKKFLSGIFASQLVASNELEGVVATWDGESWDEVADLFEGDGAAASSPADESTDMRSDDKDDVEGPPSSRGAPPIAALVSDLFYFQLTARPTWQALSFHYQRTALNAQLLPSAPIVPALGHVVVLALELEDLAPKHGPVGAVCGFDHRTYDELQEGWHQHWFPYKLAEFRKRPLTEVSRIMAPFDFSQPIQSIGRQTVDIPISAEGRCDAIVMWVDYTLAPGIELAHSINDPYLRHSVRFFENPTRVAAGSHVLKCSSEFHVGESDVRVEFELVPLP